MKTVVPRGTGGSNPSLSASEAAQMRCFFRFERGISLPYTLPSPPPPSPRKRGSTAEAVASPAAGGEGCRRAKPDEIPEERTLPSTLPSPPPPSPRKRGSTAEAVASPAAGGEGCRRAKPGSSSKPRAKDLDSYWALSFRVMLPVCQIIPTGTRISLIIRWFTPPEGKEIPTGLCQFRLLNIDRNG